MKKLFFAIMGLAIAAMTAAGPVEAGWKTWILSVQEEERVESAVKAGYSGRHVEVTFINNDWVASDVNCITGKDEEYIQLKIHSSGYVKINVQHGGDRALAEKVLAEVKKVFAEKRGE